MEPRGKLFYFAVICIAAAVACFLLFAWDMYAGMRFASRGKKVTGKVVDYMPLESPGLKGETVTTHFHLVEYDEHQREIDLKRELKPGSPVIMVYLPDQPDQFVLTERGAVGIEIVMARIGAARLIGVPVAGLVLAIFGGLVVGLRLRHERVMAEEYPDG